jgi:hypothetical protein
MKIMKNLHHIRYCWYREHNIHEFGLMMAREEMDIEEEEMDGYLEQIL